MALNLFGRGRVDHPLADSKRARDIIADLPANDATKSLQEIVEWLESVNQTEGFKLDRRLEVIDLLDSAAKNHQRRITQEYPATRRHQKSQENILWNGAYAFWRHLANAYCLCIKHHERGFSGAAAVEKSLPMIVARSLRALTSQIKWTLLRYGPIGPPVFQEIARLYRFAETRGFADTAIAVYPGAHGQGSVKQEFLKAIMLCASSTDGLTPLHQEIAERAVVYFSRSFQLSTTPGALNYCFNLAEPRSPVRRITVKDEVPSLRYFGAGDGLKQLNALIGQVKQTGVIPADFNVGGVHNKGLVIGVLKHLAQYWSDTPPTRSSERRPTTGSVNVVLGVNGIIAALDPPSVSDDLDFTEYGSAQTPENWLIVNVSEGGYCAIVPPQQSDSLKVGMLVGILTETSKDWGVGLVRRLTSDEHQQRRAGVQLLTRAAIPIKIGRPGTAAGDLEPAILLSDSPDKQGEIGVVMREGLFNGRDRLEITVRNKSHVLMPVNIVEDGEDFDWAKFKLMQHSA